VAAGAREGMRLVLLGPPGSGKGTQAERLAASFGVPKISTGDMLREAVAAGSALGAKVEAIMARGELVDDATMAAVVEERLERSDTARGFILDGYPRTVRQAETLAGILDDRGEDLDAVVLIAVSEPELVRRALGRQRADDSEGVIRERLRVYGNKTEPLVGYYRSRSLLEEVDGSPSVDAVTRSITAVLEG
jgi:adenylate kinase